MDSCPKELLAYDRAYKQKIIEKDCMIHMWIGNYGLSALTVAIEHCMHGNKAKSEYIKEPILREDNSESKNTESNEAVAVYEMKQRTKLIEKLGLPHSPK